MKSHWSCWARYLFFLIRLHAAMNYDGATINMLVVYTIHDKTAPERMPSTSAPQRSHNFNAAPNI